MSQTLLRWLVRAALCTSALAAQAQGPGSPNTSGPAPAARPDPLDATASVPGLIYSSPFARFRGLADDKPISWREANDAVARIGGWRVYAREAQQPEATPPALGGAPMAPKPAAAGKDAAEPMPKPIPMPPGHSGHKTP